MKRMMAIALLAGTCLASVAHADPGPSAGAYYTQEALRAQHQYDAAAQLAPPRGDQHQYSAYVPPMDGPRNVQNN